MVEIYSCPFLICGSEDLMIQNYIHNGYPCCHVECGKCRARGPAASTEGEAINAWNERESNENT